MSDTATSLIVTIPGTLDLALSPNRSRTHPGKRTRLKNELMDRAWLSTLTALNGNQRRTRLPLTMHIRVAWETGRNRWDDDNLIAAFKGGRDAIAAALGVDDKHIAISSVTQERDPEGRGFIEVTITESQS